MPKTLRFGIAITASEPPNEFVKTVRLAEEVGFDSIWITEYRLHRDVYVSLTLAALNTTRVRLGCAVTNPYTRHPAMTAVGIASADAVANGRAVLGLGAGGVVLDLLDVQRRRPVQACRQAVEQIRRYLGAPAASAHSADTRLDFPARADLPIFLAATGRRMLKLAGETADGVIVNVGVDKACVEAALAAVAAGAWGVKRTRGSLEMLCWLQGCAVSNEAATAYRQVKPTAALTLAHGPAWMMEAMDIDIHDVREIHRVYYAEGPRAAAELVTDEMVEKFGAAGTPQQVVRKIKRLRAQGFDEVICLPAESGENVRPALQMLAETVMAQVRT